MIVLDASAAIEWILRTEAGGAIARRILSSGGSLHAPHLVDLEVASALRKHVALHGLIPRRAQEALQDFLRLNLRRYPHAPLLPRVWELRANLTAYDAAYVALAEALGATLLTCDGKIAAAAGHRAKVEVVE